MVRLDGLGFVSPQDPRNILQEAPIVVFNLHLAVLRDLVRLQVS